MMSPPVQGDLALSPDWAEHVAHEARDLASGSHASQVGH
jgi:hypothetical protein